MKRLMLLMIVAALSIISSYPACAGEWIACAGENQYCKIPGTQMVRYGAGDRWSLQKATNRIHCSNDVFGDPAPGTKKACYYQNAPQHREEWRQPSRHDEGQKAHWVRCAHEGEFCRFDGHRNVRYGADDRWSNKSASHGISCNNDVFGDPAPGTKKACYYQNAPQQREEWRQPSKHDEGQKARWVRCAHEGEFCRFDGHRDIRYGADGRWSNKSASHGISCNNDVFGDPAPGIAKACFIRVE